MIGYLGAQSVTLLSATDGTLDRKGIPATVYTPTVIFGCSIQPISVKEDVTNIDYFIGKYNIFLPPVAAAVACKTTDYILGWASNVTDSGLALSDYVDGATIGVYRVIGPKVWTGFDGLPDHVTALSEIPSGLNG